MCGIFFIYKQEYDFGMSTMFEGWTNVKESNEEKTPLKKKPLECKTESETQCQTNFIAIFGLAAAATGALILLNRRK